jgi:hypothetical protein
MSLVILNDERIMCGFATFCKLDESIKPRETDYGTDGKNKDWSNSAAGWHHTFINHRPDHHVVVALNKKEHELAFAVHRGEFTPDASKYDVKTQRSGDAFTVLGKVLHVGLAGADTHNMKHLMIRGQTPELKEAYKTFVHNKLLQKHMKNNGWVYSHSDNDEHHFTKD